MMLVLNLVKTLAHILDRLYRVISFMVLGLMLIGASYLYYRFKKQLLPTTSKEESKR